MIVKKIQLSQFRNYEVQEILTGPGINVIYGDNAQGKTNILEAIYLCACARSHRTARDADLIYNQSGQYAVKVDYDCLNGSSESIEIRYFDAIIGDPQRIRPVRQIYHNGIRLDRISDMMGLFHAVIFAPEDLMLVKEGPSTRRRYLDLLISQVRPSYFVHLQQYARILTQRNKLLKEMRDQGFGRKKKPDDMCALQIDVWDDALAQEGAALVRQRQLFGERIAKIAQAAQKNISSGKEELYVKYRTVSGIDPNKDEKEICHSYLEKLKTMVCDDIEKGLTVAGPHRDDLELSLDGSGLKPFASQGQQRSAVLALKLAELAILREDTGEPPVFLLDDVMSELDENRRTSLLENIQKSQVFVTCTDAGQIAKELLKNSEEDAEKINSAITFFRVEDGQVSNRTGQIQHEL